MLLKPGSRVISDVCTTEMIVIKAPRGDIQLTIGGVEALLGQRTGDRSEAVLDGFGGGTKVGKRYVDADGAVELLCTKAGEGLPAIDGVLLTIKAAKPLPASD